MMICLNAADEPRNAQHPLYGACKTKNFDMSECSEHFHILLMSLIMLHYHAEKSRLTEIDIKIGKLPLKLIDVYIFV